jgi:hypothetical protein
MSQMSLWEQLPSKIRWKLKYSFRFNEEFARRCAFRIYWFLCPKLRVDRLLGKALKEKAYLTCGTHDLPKELCDLKAKKDWNLGTSHGRILADPLELKPSEEVLFYHLKNFNELMGMNELLVWIDNIFGKALQSYYGCHYRLLSMGVYKTRSTEKVHQESSQQWYVDHHPPGLLKGFVYLSDVDANDGPFTILPSSHKDKSLLSHLDQQHRLHDDHVQRSGQQPQQILGKKGTAFLANANAVHCGPPPCGEDRVVLNIYFLPSMRRVEEHLDAFGMINALSGPDRIHEPIWNDKG